MSKRAPTLGEWADLAPVDERFVPITYEGTVLYDRVSKTRSFASPSPEGRVKFRALFRTISSKAKALGFAKAVSDA